jgi:2,3-bisphosphoglycerate-independent phosphoglycerate mutase
MRPTHRILLAVLDGWGIRAEREDNAILLAGTPNLDRFAGKMPFTQLAASGLSVGLPEGQMGNSEVGHTNIGAGRIVYQDLVRINRAVERGELVHNPVLLAAMDTARAEGKALHLMGLIGPGGVHASQTHLLGLLRTAKERGVPRVFVHAFLDGRDTPPMSALGYLEELERFLKDTGTGRIATVIGRFYAMDRDKRWERVQQAYDAMVRGVGRRAPGAVEAVRASYADKVTDEFVPPTVLMDKDAPVATVHDGDAVVFFNFRSDRARELTRAMAVPDFHEFDRGGLRLGRFVCMTQYDQTFGLPVAFPPEQPREIFPEVVSEQGLTQFRTAETEKYAHVTFFFNGGREIVFPGEERALIPSPRDVKTYDQKPQMAAPEVTARLVQAVDSGKYDFLLVNYANPDMVGHTGNLEASIQAVRVVDGCLGQLADACARANVVLVITADHGNCELMRDPVTGQPHTAHTTNPVPLHLVHPDFAGAKLRGEGVLADVAPTMLKVMGLPQPKEMDRNSLLS